MDVFWRLLLAHLLADFTFQTNRLARWKRDNIWGVALHGLIFFFCSLVLCWGTLTRVWVSVGPRFMVQGWMAVVILGILHFFEDEWRIYSIQKFATPDSLFFFLWDQSIHLSLIFVFSPLNSQWLPSPWLVVISLLVIASHFTTILVYYAEKEIFKTAKIENSRKYMMIALRFLLLLTILLPSLWWVLVLPLWITSTVYYIKNRQIIWLDPILGGTVAIVCGFIARFYFYP